MFVGSFPLGPECCAHLIARGQACVSGSVVLTILAQACVQGQHRLVALRHVPPARRRYTDDETSISNAVAEVTHGPVFIKHPETMAGKQHPASLKKAGPMLRRLMALQPNLSFKMTTMSASLSHQLEEHGKEWDFRRSEHDV